MAPDSSQKSNESAVVAEKQEPNRTQEASDRVSAAPGGAKVTSPSSAVPSKPDKDPASMQANVPSLPREALIC